MLTSRGDRIAAFNFKGDVAGEWDFDADVSCLSVDGGPAGEETVLVGLTNGEVWKVFVNHPLPQLLLRHPDGIKRAATSLDKTELGVVDDMNRFCVYDLTTTKTILEEEAVTGFAFNRETNDAVCYGGQGVLLIRIGSLPVEPCPV